MPFVESNSHIILNILYYKVITKYYIVSSIIIVSTWISSSTKGSIWKLKLECENQEMRSKSRNQMYKLSGYACKHVIQ